MPRTRNLLPLLLLFTLACNLFTPRVATPTAIAPPPPTLAPATATAAPSAVPAFTAAPTGAFHLQPGDVSFHPDPQLYSGDIVSLEIAAANADPAWQSAPITIYADGQDTAPIAVTQFGTFGIGERAQATSFWTWDTTGRVGPQTLIITVGSTEHAEGSLPLDVLTLTVTLLPADQRPMPEPLARWAETESACCVFHYLTGTAAARDLAHITTTADAAFAEVEKKLGVTRTAKVPFTLLSRLLGHGGFASDEISLTYIDRDPAASDLFTVFAHEGTHLLDRQFADTRPILLTEGTAVYIAGGHFKPEDLDQRAAALLALDRYIPLTDLADNFYPSQHEIGYLEGGALAHYLVERFGWEAYKKFYSSFRPAPSDAQMLDEGLRANFGLSLSELEAEWLAHLRALTPTAAQIDDLRLTIWRYDTLRRYQQLNDPAAYFLTAWLPNGPLARDRAIVADFVRHPRAPENIALETMLAAAGEATTAQRFAEAEQLLNSVNAVLDARNLFFDPLAAQYLQIATGLQADGYEAQTIALAADTATVTAIRDWPTLDTLTLTHTISGWH